MRRLWIGAVLGSIAAGCQGIEISREVDGKVEAAFDASGPCEGEGTSADATYSKTTETVGGVEQCRIDVTWAGELVDMGDVRQRIEDEFGVSDLSVVEAQITALVLEITRVSLLDAAGNALSTPSATFDTALSIAGEPVLSLEGQGVGALLDKPVSVDVSDSLLAEAQAALEGDMPLFADSTSTLHVPSDELPALQAAPGPIALEVDVHADVTAVVSQAIF